ncbi:TipC family immunity protein [Streptococcus cameli]
MIKVFRKIVYIVMLMAAFYFTYFAWSYRSITNVFLEMNHAATHYEYNILRLPNLSDVLQSERRYKDTYRVISLPIKTDLSQDEGLAVLVGRYQSFGLEFRKELEENIFLYITFTYKNGKLVEELEISNSDTSLSEALQSYYVDKKEDGESNKSAVLQTAYWFSSSKGLPSLQLTDTKNVLEYLKPYEIDEEWLHKKADYMLYNIVLKRWFEAGSQRYSFDNLGEVEIVPLNFED